MGARSRLRRSALAVGAVATALAAAAVVALLVTAARVHLERPESSRLDAGSVAGPGRIELDVDGARLVVARGEPGAGPGLSVDADPRAYRVSRELTPPGGPGDGWTLRVEFRPTSRLHLGALRAAAGVTRARVRVEIPPDAPIALHARVVNGTADVELGGLWLTEVTIDARRAGVSVAASSPTREPVERVHVDSRVGGLDVRSIGNASPRQLRLHQGVPLGGATVDLGGAWLEDGEATVTVAFGHGTVILPGSVVVRGVEGASGLAPRQAVGEATVPVLDLHVHYDVGALHVVR